MVVDLGKMIKHKFKCVVVEILNDGVMLPMVITKCYELLSFFLIIAIGRLYFSIMSLGP